MLVVDTLRKFNDVLSNKILFAQQLNYSVQKEYLDSLPEPVSDIERSYNQYLCQVFSTENKISLFLKNVISFILLPFYLHKSYAQIMENFNVKNPIIYIMINNKTDMLPDIIKNSQHLVTVKMNEGFFLDKEDISFIKTIQTLYPHSYYFIYKILLKVGLYSSIIRKYKPQEIVVNGETSFTSSVLTEYCELKGIKHTDVMHGEKVFWIRDAFFRFTNCYVWSKYHIDLFHSLRATQSKYIISLPVAMRFDASKFNIKPCMFCDYKFYLGYETKSTLLELKKVIILLEKGNQKVLIRPHPIYTDIKLLQRLFRSEQIENTSIVSIEESIVSSKNVVSIFSTVLRQAFYAGTRIVVDDCTNVSKYEEMKNLKFWLYENNPPLLSKEIKQFKVNFNFEGHND